jgi:hypothetical protein
VFTASSINRQAARNLQLLGKLGFFVKPFCALKDRTSSSELASKSGADYFPDAV